MENKLCLDAKARDSVACFPMLISNDDATPSAAQVHWPHALEMTKCLPAKLCLYSDIFWEPSTGTSPLGSTHTIMQYCKSPDRC